MGGLNINPLNLVIIIVIFATMYYEFRLASICKEKFWVAVPVILWLVNSLLFYFFVFIEADFVMEWSRALRLHGYLVMLMLSVYRYKKYYNSGGRK